MDTTIKGDTCFDAVVLKCVAYLCMLIYCINDSLPDPSICYMLQMRKSISAIQRLFTILLMLASSILIDCM